MAGKTAKRVLVTALALFNEHGENSVTSVDIAMEMDISPGNLYYHFKGKELIVDALIEWHNTEMQQLFRPATLDKVTVEDFFYFLAIVIDKLQVFRFLYRRPAIRGRFVRFAAAICCTATTCRDVCTATHDGGSNQHDTDPKQSIR